MNRAWLILDFTIVFSPAQAEYNSTGALYRSLIGGKFSNVPNTGPQWVDYPAFALSMPPGAAAMGTQESWGGKKGKGGKKGLPPSLVPSPLFDIVVEPEYIPDPFPVPYPYPIEQGMIPSTEMNPTMDTPRKPRYKRQQFIERSEPEWRCPQDYIPEAGNCVRIDQVEVDIGCPEGWKFDGNNCRAMDVIPPDAICDTGFVPWDSNPECVREIIAPREMICPPGFIGTEKGCKKNIETAAVAVCQDSVLVGNTCRRPTMAEPLATCPPEFISWEDPHLCYKETIVEGDLMCPSLHHLVDNSVCEKRTKARAQITCPQSFHLDGDSCLREISESPTIACESGELRPDGNCFLREIGTAPDLVCNPGYGLNLHTQSCELDVEVPATITCPVAYVLFPETEQCVPVKTKGKSAAALPPIFECPSNLEYSKGHRCVGRLTQAVQVVCPSPYALRDGECINELVTDPLLLCPIGSELVGTACVHLESTNPNVFCMPGFDLTVSGDCESLEIANPLTKCPPGFVNTVGNSMCQRMEKLDATLICPPLMVLTKEPNHPKICRGEDVFNPEYTCTVEGMVLEFQHEGPICKGIHVEPPTFVCPIGFKDEIRGCVKYDVTPKRAICPEGYIYSFDVCVKEITQPPVLLCPTGYIHQQSSETCYRERFTDMLPLCPPDMEFDRLVGECFKLKVEYDFDEDIKPPEEQMKDLPGPPPPSEVPRDVEPPPPPPMHSIIMPPPPPPQLTVIQQPVVVPQPAIILPQQAPVPPPPAIRVPYGVPQAIPTPAKPKHQHIIHHQTQHVVVPAPPPPPPPPVMAFSAKKKTPLNYFSCSLC
eukprot:Gregarina_sp_Poly_1__2223@NODE_1594_length_3758_cov_19_792468_g1050_i0_p1_GENE_NODE_1594_length_3758_cov_19_792468_g1050_i0NODE_1594_length_3758_cov_19_792468_g1050_i0_p1_ORF_typecomplete_len824_score74_20Baculo_VP91_N/PF08475_10/1_2Baculo_VP91_N/PF08475_10/7_2e02_NODE_1594_length_3758_cov_19_792468_g1050_i06473118